MSNRLDDDWVRLPARLAGGSDKRRAIFTNSEASGDPDLATLERELDVQEAEFLQRLRAGPLPACDVYGLEDARSAVRVARLSHRKNSTLSLIVLEP